MNCEKTIPPSRERDVGGRFGPGNAGRPKGARNKTSQALAQAILADFHAHKDEVLARLRREELVAYVRFVSRLLPAAVEEVEEPPPEEFSEAVARSRLGDALVRYNNGRNRSLDLGLDKVLADPERRASLEALSAGLIRDRKERRFTDVTAPNGATGPPLPAPALPQKELRLRKRLLGQVLRGSRLEPLLNHPEEFERLAASLGSSWPPPPLSADP